MLNRTWPSGDDTSQLLLNVAAGRAVPSGAALSNEGFGLGVEHGLVGLMATGLPGPIATRARPPFTRMSARQQVMVRHLQRVLQTFDEGGIRATVVKGPYLARFAYRQPAHRTFTDVDVLVHPDDLAHAIDLLREDPAVSGIPAQGPKADKRNILVTDPDGIHFTLDLHWDLYSYSQLQGCARGATELAWSQAERTVDSHLGPLWHLPDAAIICFLCTHALLDHRFRLILFRDLTEVALHEPDWEAVGSFAGRWGLRSSTYLALSMASRLTDAPVPPEFLQALRPRSAAIRLTENLLSKTDLVRFDGHQPHPLNLAIVLLHDSALGRLRLAARAPMAFPNWRRRVGLGAPRERTTSKAGDSSLVVLVTTDRRRGAEVFGERLTGALKERGWDVNLLALSHDTKGPRIDAHVVSESTPEQLGRLDLNVILGLRRKLKELKTRVILANGSSTLQYALTASLALRPRVRVVYSSIGEPKYWIRSNTRRRIQHALLSQADLVLAVSESTKRQLVNGVGLADEAVEVAPTGVPDAFFDVQSDLSDHPDLRLLFLGNLSREKRPMAALDVVSRVSRTLPVQLRFVGEGPLQASLRARVETLGLTGSVAFHGSVDDVTPHLAWADLLLLTSETEGLPGVVLEAAATGVPTVAFNVGGAPETILAGITGELVAPGDVDALCAAVAKLGADRAMLVDMGRRAKKLMGERFSLDQAVDLYDEILSRQVQSGRGRSMTQDAG